MKAALVALFVLAAFVCQASARQWTEAELESLKKLDFNQLPRELQIIIKKEKKSGGDASNWCCMKEQPVKPVQTSRVQVWNTTKVQTKMKVGNTKCGFLWLKKCSKYELGYTTQPTYYIAYYEEPNPSQIACLEKDRRCCAGFTEVAGNCINPTKLKSIQGLIAAGIIG